jgi:hypothetical protein
MNIKAQARALRQAKRRELEALYPALRRKERPVAPTPARPPAPRQENRIVIGRDANGLAFSLSDESRYRHCHIIGAPGSGKSNSLAHQIRQDIHNGACVVLLDPHGNDPQSVYHKTLRWLSASGMAGRRRIHVIDPSSAFTCGHNPLHCPEGTDPTVVANNGLEAVERGWGDRDLQDNPSLRRGTRANFTAVAELGLTLLEAPYFLTPEDDWNLRAWALEKLKDDRARAYFERLTRLAANPRMAQTFEVETIGILNRIEEFTSSAAIRRVFGQPKGIDFRDAMDGGEVVLVNLAGGTDFYEKEGDLLGRMLLRSILFNAKRRTNSRPCFIWMDEGHRYLSGDVPVLFEEVRKHAVGVTVAHQTISQLGEPGDRVREAVLSVPQNRLVFRINSMSEAALLAPEVVQLNLELPVSILVKPTVIGDELVKLRNAGISSSSGTTTTTGVSVTDSTSVTDQTGENWNTAEAKGVTLSTSHSEAIGEAHTKGTSRTVTRAVGGSETDTETDSDSYGTSTGGSANYSSSSSAGLSSGSSREWSQPGNVQVGTSTSSGRSSDRTSSRGGGSNWSEQSGSSTARSHASTSSWSEAVSNTVSESTTNSRTTTETHGRADTHTTTKSQGGSKSRAATAGQAVGKSRSTGISEQSGHSAGWSETYRAVYANLPSAVHSKENVVHRAAETINKLPTGVAVVKALVGGNVESALVLLPPAADAPGKGSVEDFIAATPTALPNAAADKLIADRREWLKAEAARLIEPLPEPTTYRQPLSTKHRTPAPKGEDHD